MTPWPFAVDQLPSGSRLALAVAEGMTAAIAIMTAQPVIVNVLT
jgi:hypothetical protein